jgi:hypothetical protein
MRERGISATSATRSWSNGFQPGDSFFHNLWSPAAEG